MHGKHAQKPQKVIVSIDTMTHIAPLHVMYYATGSGGALQ